eukprot:9501152-Pyramimonas_sp.AAC.1
MTSPGPGSYVSSNASSLQSPQSASMKTYRSLRNWRDRHHRAVTLRRKGDPVLVLLTTDDSRLSTRSQRWIWQRRRTSPPLPPNATRPTDWIRTITVRM